MTPRDAARAIAQAGQVDPTAAVRRHLQAPERGWLRLGRHFAGYQGRIWLVGAGKASAALARGVAEVVPQLAGGLVVVPEGVAVDDLPVPARIGDHPLPGARSAAAAAELHALLATLPPDDLVLAAWSGGGSALLGWPTDGVDLAGITRVLLDSGADIHAINTVRRRLSRSAGGRLRAATRAPALQLGLSDVPAGGARTRRDDALLPWVDDPLHHAALASGPMCPDPTSRDAAAALLRQIGRPMWIDALLPDVAVPRGPYAVVGGADDALHAAAHAARTAGWVPVVLDAAATGSVDDVVARVVAAIDAAVGGPPLALLLAGEPTVAAPPGSGRGGRCSHAAALLARAVAGRPVAAAILATDGCDGPSGTGGAVIDGDTAAPGLDAALSAHDTGSWLTAAGCALPEGPTGTQVGDLWVVLVGAPPPSADAAS